MRRHSGRLVLVGGPPDEAGWTPARDGVRGDGLNVRAKARTYLRGKGRGRGRGKDNGKGLPRWLMWLGLGIALACELASLTLLDFRAGYLIPVGRYLSIVWMLGVALKLPKTAVEGRS